MFLTNLVEARSISIQGDIVELIAGDVAGNFKTLLALLTDLKLVDELKGMTEQTIFAPSDKAFEKLPKGTLDGWTTEQKMAIVKRHVIANVTIELAAADIKTDPVVTLGGETIDLIKTELGVQISYKDNTVNVVLSDTFAKNVYFITTKCEIS